MREKYRKVSNLVQDFLCFYCNISTKLSVIVGNTRVIQSVCEYANGLCEYINAISQLMLHDVQNNIVAINIIGKLTLVSHDSKHYNGKRRNIQPWENPGCEYVLEWNEFFCEFHVSIFMGYTTVPDFIVWPQYNDWFETSLCTWEEITEGKLYSECYCCC